MTPSTKDREAVEFVEAAMREGGATLEPQEHAAMVRLLHLATERVEQLERGPVAWRVIRNGEWIYHEEHPFPGYKDTSGVDPLYTAPPTVQEKGE